MQKSLLKNRFYFTGGNKMTIDRIRINGKYMEEKLKRGFGTNDFINHLNISEEEFFHCLKKTFSTKSYNLICKRIRNNEKRQANFPLNKQLIQK